MKTICISCQGADFISIDVLLNFQGNLKSLSILNYKKLKKQILDHGFIEPVSVWKFDDKFYLLNGHQRVHTLIKMKEEGYVIPEIPVNWVSAENWHDAKQKLLSLNSQYGNMTYQGLFEFISEANLKIKQDKCVFFNIPTLQV